MKAIDIKRMICCDDVILPKINTRQEPYTVYWKCPICGDSRKQIIPGSDLLVLEIVESINTNQARPDS
ncbi:MAG: hypothetical protein ACMUIM_05095 [bacterium]